MNGNLKTMADSQISPRTPLDKKEIPKTLIGMKQLKEKGSFGPSLFKTIVAQADSSKNNKPANDQEFKRRALIVQESLLSYIKNADKSKDENKGNPSTSTLNTNKNQIKFDNMEIKGIVKEEQKVSSVKNTLRNFH